MNKEIMRFFERLSNEDDNYKLTTDRMLQIIKESDFNDEIKKELCSRIESHKHCEFDDLEVNPFAVCNYGDNISLECESCYTTIIDSNVLDEMI